MSVSDHDRNLLRTLAGRMREHADSDAMAQRRKLLKDINHLQADRPAVLVYPEGCWGELVNDGDCECEDPLLRQWELHFRSMLFIRETVKPDNAFDAFFDVNWVFTEGDLGVEIDYTHGENRGSYVWESPIKEMPADLAKLRFRRPTVDRAETDRRMALADELFGDILPARRKHWFYWTSGLTTTAIRLIGLERLMLAMYDEPENLHQLMAFLRDDQMQYIQWFEDQNLYTLNNADGYVGSGGMAYTDELPADDYNEGEPVRLKDLWGFAESQETVGVSPEMFAEFVLPYQMPLLEKFGLNCYGCCEAIDQRWDYVKTIPNLRRCSVSPWCDQEVMAEKLGGDYVFSRKPNPAPVCTTFSEKAIREDLRHTLDVARNCQLEIILKDTHTVQHEPERLARWVEIAREEIDKTAPW